MNFFKRFFPNLTIALAAALLVVAIVNEYNPRMGFLLGKSALVLIILCCLCSIISAAALYITWRKNQ